MTTPLLEWVHPRELPEPWARLLDPNEPVQDGVVFVPKVVQTGLALLLWAPLGGLICFGGVAVLAASIAGGPNLSAAVGGLVGLGMMGLGCLGLVQAPRALRQRTRAAEGRFRFGVFITDEAVLVRFSRGEVALIPRDRVQSTDWTRFQSENAGQAHPGHPGLVYTDDAGEACRIDLPDLTTDGPEGLRRRLAAWAAGQPYEEVPSEAPDPSEVNWAR